MRLVLALALLLASPLSARAQRLAIVPAEPVGVAPNVIGTFPLDGVFVYRPDPRCPGNSTILPDLAVAVCVRAAAAEWITREVLARRLVPGPGWIDCTYPSDPAWPSCVEFSIRSRIPEIRWGQSAAYGLGAIGGVPYFGCAAGVALGPFIRVSIVEHPRCYTLVGHETANVLLSSLDRYLDTDGPLAGSAATYAVRACGVN